MKIDYYNEIKLRYGNVRRAKAYYLYTEKNIRLLDLYLDNGMSILGRRNNQSQLVFKQFVDKGLYAFLPSTSDYNLKKALSLLFPTHSEFRLYSSYFDCLQSLKIINSKSKFEFSVEAEKIFQENLWRPFLPESVKLLEKDAFFVQTPICSAFKILVFKNRTGLNLTPSNLMPATEKAAIARSFFDLQKKIHLYNKTENLNDDDYLKCTSTKRQRKQAEHSLRQYNSVLELGAKYWDFKGPYLYPKINEAEYKAFFYKALDAHILISPDFFKPSFLPKLQNYTDLLNLLK